MDDFLRAQEVEEGEEPLKIPLSTPEEFNL
jgi:hypothetical protein